MSRNSVAFAIALAIICSSSVRALIIHVPADSASIQAGIDGAAAGDTVLVQPGVYPETIVYDGMDIIVGSLYLTTNDTAYISSTIIDKVQDGPVVTFSNGIGADEVLSGFSVTNSSALFIGNMIACLQSSPTLSGLKISGSVYDSMVDGGGIWCMDYSSPTLTNVTISDNEAASGGGMFCYLHSNPTLSNVTIAGNYALFGGGLYCNYSSSPILSNVSIVDNNAANMGGGIECYDNSSPILTNVIIARNSAEYGGGIYAGSNISPVLANVTVTGNTATAGGGARFYSNANPTLINSIFSGNSPSEIDLFDELFNSVLTVSYSDIEGGKAGIVTNYGFTGTIEWLEGNIDSNPRFVPFPLRGFEYLLAPSSPCIDAGDPLLGDGFEWPVWYQDQARSDIGAYGGPGNQGWLSR